MDLQDDEQPEDAPLDDIGFDLDDAQAEIHDLANTRKHMEKVADAIWGSLQEFASTMTYVKEPRRGRRR